MPRQSSSALILLLAAANLAAQTPKPVEKPASVEGVVSHALTGDPIARAHVMCDGTVAGKQQMFGAMTNAEGKFSITGLPAGNYFLRVERTGFIAPVENGMAGARAILRPGEAKSDVKLKLTPTGAILGRVVDADGNPLEGAIVSADAGTPSQGRGSSSTTDEKGQFRLGGLPPGKYRVRALLSMLPFPPEIRTDGSQDIHYAATYHPDSIEAKGATRVAVRSGADVTGVDIHMQRTPIVRVSGIVTGIPANTPTQSVGIELSSDNAGSRSFNGVAPDGKFVVWNVEPGKWKVAARVNQRGEMLRSAPTDIEIVRDHVDNLELRMLPAFDVSGQLEFEDDSARPRPPVAGGPPPRMALQELSRVGGNRGTMPIGPSADGAFRFTAVQPGKYRFNYGWYASLKSIRLGTVEMPDQILDLSNGTGGATVTVVFGPASAEVTGVVRDDNGPVAGAGIVLRNPSIGTGSTNSVRTTTTGADGRYSLTNVPAGKYVLFAADEGDATLMSGNYEDYEDVLVELQVGKDKVEKDLKRHRAPDRLMNIN